MLAMIQRHLRTMVFLTAAGVGLDRAKVFPPRNGLIPVATNVWSAPNRTLKKPAEGRFGDSWKEKPAIPVKTPGFIPLQPAGNHNGPHTP